MKTTNKITGLGKTALIILSAMFIFSGIKAENRKLSPNAYMMNLEALMNHQNEILKYKAPETTETDVTEEINNLDCLISATDNLLKYNAPSVDEDIEIGLELLELEMTFTALYEDLKYSAPQYTDMPDEFDATSELMYAETK